MAVHRFCRDAIAAEDTFAVVTSCQIRLDSNGTEQDTEAATAGYPYDENSSKNDGEQKLGTLVRSCKWLTVGNTILSVAEL